MPGGTTPDQRAAKVTDEDTVREFAKAHGLSYAQALKQAEAEGYTVKKGGK